MSAKRQTAKDRTLLEQLFAEPHTVHVFDALRAMERAAPDKPRIGESQTRREEIVSLGQDPSLEFAAEAINAAKRRDDGLIELRVRYLGLLGPQGALPLAFVEEALDYAKRRDDAFPRFLDIFNNRFLQLFFRAWAASQPLAGNDRPEADRTRDYIGSAIGLNATPLMAQDHLGDDDKRYFAGLMGAQSKSASRLASLLQGLFGQRVEIIECVGTRLTLEPQDRTQLGRANNRLGVDALAGASVLTFEDKFTVTLHVDSLARYELFLPLGASAPKLRDAVCTMVGDQFEWTVALSLDVREAAPVQLGRTGRLGWTSWLGDARQQDVTDGRRQDARFNLAARRDLSLAA